MVFHLLTMFTDKERDFWLLLYNQQLQLYLCLIASIVLFVLVAYQVQGTLVDIVYN